MEYIQIDDHEWGEDWPEGMVFGSCDECGCDLTDPAELIDHLCDQCDWMRMNSFGFLPTNYLDPRGDYDV